MNKLHLGYQLLIAAILAIFTGLFFGPLCSIFQPIWEIFHMLVEMVVFPYIAISLIYGIGSINPQIGKRLLKKSCFFLALLWVIGFAAIYILSYLIPGVETEAAVRTHNPMQFLSNDYLLYFIPQNPLFDLANNRVAAIAIFGVIGGSAFMFLPQKEPILGLLDRTAATLEKLLDWLVVLSPLGAFVNIAGVIGTVDGNILYEMRYFELFYIVFCLFLTFWVLPQLIISMTSYKYKEVMGEFFSICLPAFATALSSLVLPFLGRLVKRLIADRICARDPLQPISQTVIPLGYSFGQIGNGILLFFLMFISFYFRYPFSETENFLLPFLTWPLSFGTHSVVFVSLPLCIQQYSLPPETLSLFEDSWSILANFQVLLSVMGIATFLVLSLFSYYGLLEIKWKRLAFHVLLPFFVLGVAVVGLKNRLSIQDSYQNLYPKVTINEVIKDPVPAKVFTEIAVNGTSSTGGTLQKILREGVLKVGYDAYSMPFSYLNEKGELVGYDVAMAYQLARDLDCRLEFYQIDWDRLGLQLANGVFDIAMAGVMVDEDRLTAMEFSQVYQEQFNTLVIPISAMSRFSSLAGTAAIKNLSIAAFGATLQDVKVNFPLAHFVNFKNNMAWLTDGKVDSVMTSEIMGFAWCLSHPEFTLQDFNHSLGRKYLAYAVKINSYDWISFINNWMDLKRQYGFTESQNNLWIKGRISVPKEPRWSILRNVLHWID